jgi:hypothetical protein
MERHHRNIRGIGGGGSTILGLVRKSVHVVGDLEVEEPWALMSLHVLLVAVVAEALVAALEHLSQR